MSDKEISDVVMPLAATLFSIGTAPAELANMIVGLMEEQAGGRTRWRRRAWRALCVGSKR